MVNLERFKFYKWFRKLFNATVIISITLVIVVGYNIYIWENNRREEKIKEIEIKKTEAYNKAYNLGTIAVVNFVVQRTDGCTNNNIVSFNIPVSTTTPLNLNNPDTYRLVELINYACVKGKAAPQPTPIPEVEEEKEEE